MKKNILFGFFILVANLVFAQKYQIKGKVLSGADSTVISQAIVTCHPDSMKNWGFTEENGNFMISGAVANTKKISISCVGYKKIDVPVHFIGQVADLGVILLPVQIYEIKNVMVRSDIPLVIKYGDTIQYNVTAMKLNEDWNALDLVSRFPGVFIIDNQIMVNGEPLMKVLLDGKEYYGDDVMNALVNIPASAIRNIQAYGKESDHARLTGFKDMNMSKVFNVRTKNPMAKKGWANVAAVEGLNTNGVIHNIYGLIGNGTFDNPKHRLVVDFKLTNLNGIANDRFVMGNSITPLLSIAPSVLYRLSETKSGHLSYGYTTEKLKFSLAGDVIEMNSNNHSSNLQNYFPVENVFDSKELNQNSTNNQNIFGYGLDFNMEWTLSKKQSLLMKFRKDGRTTDEHTTQNELILQDGDSVSYSHVVGEGDGRNDAYRGDFAWYYRINPGKRALNVLFNYVGNPSIRNNTPESYLNKVFDKSSMEWVTSVANNDYRQLSDIANDIYNATISYNESIGKNHQLKLLLDNRTFTMSNVSSVYRYDDVTDEYTTFYRDRSNHTKLESSSTRAILYYNYLGSKKIRLSMNLGATYMNQSFDDRLNLGYYTKSNAVMFLADFLISRKFTPKSSLDFSYNTAGNMPNAQDLSPIIIDNNPSQIRIGNPNLKNSRDNRFSLRYRREGESLFSANISVRLSDNAVVRVSEFMPTDRDTVIYAVNVDTVGRGYIPQRGAVVMRNENRTGGVDVSSGMTYGFIVKPLASNLSFSLNYTYSKRNAYEKKNDYIRNHKTSFDFSLSSTISKNIDFKLLYKINYSVRNNQGGNPSEMLTNGAAGQFSIAFLKVMRITTTGVWYNEKQFGNGFQRINTLSLNGSLTAYLTSQHDFILSFDAVNLLDNDKGLSNFLTDTYFSQTRNDGFGRYLSLKLSYKFNSMNKKRPKLSKEEKSSSGGFFDN